MAQFEPGVTVRTKKRCCNSDPRCKKCPVAWRRLAKAGLAQRVDGREYLVLEKIRKKDLEAVRCKH
jgi:hypothetical protein